MFGASRGFIHPSAIDFQSRRVLHITPRHPLCQVVPATPPNICWEKICCREIFGLEIFVEEQIFAKYSPSKMSQKFQESSSSRDGGITTSRVSPKVRRGWLAPPALRLALRYFCMNFILCVKSTRCPRDGTPAFGSSCAVPPQKSVGLFSLRVGCSVAWKFGMDTNSLEWNERPRVVSFHSNRSSPVKRSQDTP